MSKVQKVRQRRKHAAATAAAIVGVGMAGSAFAANYGPSGANVNGPNGLAATGSCTGTLAACTTTGSINCSITKQDTDTVPPNDNSNYHLKWRLKIKDGQTNAIRYWPTSSDGTGFRSLFVYTGTSPATQSGSTSFSAGGVGLGANEYYTNIEWKVCDDGTLGGGGICGTESSVVSWKC